MALISCTKSHQAPDHLRKGAWSKEEDALLRKCVESYGEGNWHSVPGRAGLKRCRKSCRLRWLNYLCPRINRGKFSEQEDDLILRLHRLLGNRWSLIAGRLPGRTANDIKNHWNTNLSKKMGASSSKADRRSVDAKIIKPRPYKAKGRWISSTELQPAGLIEFEKEQTGIAKLPTTYENYGKEQNNKMAVNEHGDCTVPEIDNSTTWDLHDAFGIRDLDDIRDDELLLEGVHAWEERLWETIFSS